MRRPGLHRPPPYTVLAFVIISSLAADVGISVTIGIIIEFVGILYFLEGIHRARKGTRRER